MGGGGILLTLLNTLVVLNFVGSMGCPEWHPKMIGEGLFHRMQKVRVLRCCHQMLNVCLRNTLIIIIIIISIIGVITTRLPLSVAVSTSFRPLKLSCDTVKSRPVQRCVYKRPVWQYKAISIWVDLTGGASLMESGAWSPLEEHERGPVMGWLEQGDQTLTMLKLSSYKYGPAWNNMIRYTGITTSLSSSSKHRHIILLLLLVLLLFVLLFSALLQILIMCKVVFRSRGRLYILYIVLCVNLSCKLFILLWLLFV